MANIGERLKAAREKKDLDYKQVHLDTKISPAILKALEESRADEAVGVVYAKTFLKKYANYLGLDADNLVKEYEEEHKIDIEEEADEQSIEHEEGRFSGIKIEQTKMNKKSLLKNILVVLAVVLAVVGIFAGGAKLVSKIQSLEIFKSEPKQTETQAETTSGSRTALFPIPEDKELQLTVNTSAKVWVKIEADGLTLSQSILDAKSEETWKAGKEFKITIGRPEAVSVKLNGKSVSFPKGKKIKGTLITHNGIKY